MKQTLFTNVKVLDCSGAEPYPGEVLVDGNRIKAVARDAASLPSNGADVIDGNGATLMPGMTEAHTHLSFDDTPTLESLGMIPPEEHTLLAVRNAKLYLDHGFTSCLSAAAAKPRLDVVVRNAINAGDFPGPRLLAASPELTVTGGFGDVNRVHLPLETCTLVADGPDEFRKISRTMIREGVDTLKIDPSGDEVIEFARGEQTLMNDAEAAAVAEVAKSHGKRVAAHARSAQSVKMCVRHGIEIVYHATFCDEEGLDMLEANKDWLFVAPAIGHTYAFCYEAADFGVTAELAAKHAREIESASKNIEEMHRRGVRVLIGGDYGLAWNPHGRNARDLEHFVNLFDYTPMEAILAATKLGGEIMMLGDELGQIKEGFLADLLLVDGDPLENLALLQKPENLIAIMKDGEFHKKPATAAGSTAPKAGEAVSVHA